jgi:hypothetical protein
LVIGLWTEATIIPILLQPGINVMPKINDETLGDAVGAPIREMALREESFATTVADALSLFVGRNCTE